MRRLVPCLLLLVTLLPQAALAGEWYRCRADRKVRDACCCPATPASEKGGATAERPELRRTDCCDVIRSEPRALKGRAETASGARSTGSELVGVTSPLPRLGVAAGRACALAARATAPPLGLAPIYLRHASLLL